MKYKFFFKYNQEKKKKKLSEIFLNFTEKLSNLQDQDEWKLYTLFSFSNQDFYDNELQKSFLKDVEFNLEMSFSQDLKTSNIPIKEIQITENFDYKQFLNESGLKCSRFMIYFCNIILFHQDSCLRGLSAVTYPIFSSYCLSVLEKKLYDFFSDFICNLEMVIILNF